MQKDNSEQFDGIASSTIRQLNRKLIQESPTCHNSFSELKRLEKFLSRIGFLFFGRDFIFCNNKVFSLQIISTSLELTMGSIISCCENGCIADANSLLRKYRDDMFFYLYLLVYDSEYKMEHEASSNQKREETISQWMENNLRNFQITQLLKSIANSEYCKEAIDKYNLKASFDKIGRRLNNYVHSNGYAYYNQNVNAYGAGALENELSEIVIHAKYITIVFLFLLILCAPHWIMSEDYMDYLDFGETPPEGSPYWVAPFIIQFIKENISLIDDQCFAYLKNNTQMQFD